MAAAKCLCTQTFGGIVFHVKRNQESSAANLLRRQAHRWGIELDPDQLAMLEQYAELLSNYALANVIGTRDNATILLDHITDALSCALTGHLAVHKRMIDVGTVCGLPGIQLRIAFPHLLLTLLEATVKKARFMETAVEELDLPEIAVVNRRAEDIGLTVEHRDSFDIAVARAVAALPVVIEYCAPFVKTGGVIIAMKGRPSSEELDAGARAATEVGAKLETVLAVAFIPEMVQKERNLVVLRKTRATPRGFPRRIGLAKQRPLGGEGGR